MFKSLEKHIDMVLCQQMADLIYRLSKEKEKTGIYNLLWREFLFQEDQEMPATMEDAYELKYPGEVLERLKERTELSMEKIRALAIAIAVTKGLQDERMYVGTQYTSFIKMVEKLADKNEIFLSGALYLLGHKKRDVMLEQIRQYPYKNAGEIIYILSILPDDGQIWESVKMKLNQFLGVGRVFDVYENTGIYIWIARNLGQRMKGYRKKDIDVIKYITRLPFVYAQAKNHVGIKIREAGYTEAEVIFLNLELARHVKLPEALWEKTMTIEKMAVNACHYYLSGDEQHPEAIYKLCGDLFQIFKDYEIKINGDTGIIMSLHNLIRVGNIRSYQFLYQYRKWNGVNPEWLNIDLTDRKWFPIFEWLGKEKFDQLVDSTLFTRQYQDNDLKLYLSNYRKVTGSEYKGTLWERFSYKNEDIFFRLASLEYINPAALMKEYIQEYQNSPENMGKWEHMLNYLCGYIKKGQTQEAYQIMKIIDGEIGMENLDKLISARDFLFDCFGIQTWGRHFDNMDFMRIYLSPEENYQIFHWIEQQVFLGMPENYMNFLIHVLSNTDNLLWLPKENAQKIFRQLAKTEEKDYRLKSLMKTYLSEEEQEERERTERLKEERAQLFEKLQEEKQRKKKFNKIVAVNQHSGQMFFSIKKYLDSYYWEKKGACKIVGAYILKRCSKGRLFLTRKEIYHLIAVLETVFKEEGLQMVDIKQIICNAQEVGSNE